MVNMNYLNLGNSDLKVSSICLGTMTWGNQNTEPEAHQQIEYALDQGINFIDTAEMYAVPPSQETQGLTEQYIGTWLQANPQRRADIVLATKMTGSGIPWVRDGAGLLARHVEAAVDGSLRRLRTDYIDLYQLHWPNRKTPHFGKHWPGGVEFSEVEYASERDQLLELMQALDDCVKAGKIRYCGLSNETPWGLQEYLRLAAQHDLPRMVSMQNEFNLLHATDFPHMFEACVAEDVAYLPWSPLAGGALSGKYRNGARPEGCRWTMVQRNGLFRDTTYTHAAIDAYWDVAQAHGLSLTQLALAWVYQFAGVTSTIIGATSLPQLEEDIAAYELSLSESLLSDIDGVFRKYPIPF